jgi:oxygen-independent coproporphyrinogen-3 oxidase
MEVNPGTVDLGYLMGIRRLGVNRLSIGIQSFDENELKMLERQHSNKQNDHIVKEARRAGFENISLDLIFGLPGQSISYWKKSLKKAVTLEPEHLSLYALTIEPGTPIASQIADGFQILPDPDTTADMYEWTMEYLDKQGYFQYEISNWAKENSKGKLLESKHNKQYWLNQPYLGFGAGAHGFAGGCRTENVLSPSTYIDLIQNGAVREYPLTPATVNFHEIDTTTEMQETLMRGLRLIEEGVGKSRFFNRFNKEIEEVFAPEIDELIDFGLVEWGGEDKNTLRLTQRGRLLGNQVFMRFV